MNQTWLVEHGVAELMDASLTLHSKAITKLEVIKVYFHVSFLSVVFQGNNTPRLVLQF